MSNLPFKPGNSGGENCDDMCDARCGGKNKGGVVLVVEFPSKTGLNPVLQQKKSIQLFQYISQ